MGYYGENSLKEIKDKLIKHSRTLGIDKIGFTTGEPFYELRSILEEHSLKGLASGLEEKDINFRIDPDLSLPGVKSIIAIAVAYPNRYFAIPGEDNQEPRGMFCRASWGKDYHIVIKEKLTLLSDYLKFLLPGCQTKIMIDTGPLSDRAVARRAGLGWIGKNGSLVTEEFGSFVFLGELLTDVPFEPDGPSAELCGNCRKCISSCPAQAIRGNSLIDCQRCLAFQTINKRPLNDEIKIKIAENMYIYGCDVCQLACPFNQGRTNDWHEEFESNYDLIYPPLKQLLKITNKEFTRQFGEISGSWRGKKVLQRNALFLLGKSRDSKNLSLLKEILEKDPRGDIRATAVWALGNYESAEVREILEARLAVEQDSLVIAEIKKILGK